MLYICFWHVPNFIIEENWKTINTFFQAGQSEIKLLMPLGKKHIFQQTRQTKTQYPEYFIKLLDKKLCQYHNKVTPLRTAAEDCKTEKVLKTFLPLNNSQGRIHGALDSLFFIFVHPWLKEINP